MHKGMSIKEFGQINLLKPQNINMVDKLLWGHQGKSITNTTLIPFICQGIPGRCPSPKKHRVIFSREKLENLPVWQLPQSPCLAILPWKIMINTSPGAVTSVKLQFRFFNEKSLFLLTLNYISPITKKSKIRKFAASSCLYALKWPHHVFLRSLLDHPHYT